MLTRNARRSFPDKLLGLLTLALATLFLGSGTAGGAGKATTTTIESGHVDYAAKLIGPSLASQIKDGSSGATVWREPESVVLKLGDPAKVSVPASAPGFLGTPGTSIWLIPQVQKKDVVWLGWNTEEVAPASGRGPLEWSLTSVEGPGPVTVFNTEAFGTYDVIFNSADGLPDSRMIPLGVHAHGNWAFREPGTYRLGLRWAWGGAEPQSHAATLTIEVGSGGDDPPPTDPPGDGTPGKPDPPGAKTPSVKPRLELRSARVRGNRVRIAMRLGNPSRLRVLLRRGGRVVARSRKAHAVGGNVRVRWFAMNRKPGRRKNLVAVVRARSVTGAVETRSIRVGPSPARRS